jgi:hypothetical protein
VRFTDFLRTAVLLSAGAASALAAVAVAGAARDGDSRLAAFAAGWWLVAAAIGAFLGRGTSTTPAIGRLLANAKATPMLPEHRPGAILINRLWPLVVSTIAAGGVAFVAPQVPGIAAGFAIIWALTWRRQPGAVTAIEGRDGVRFYVERTSPVEPMALLRTPGLRLEVPELDAAA